MDWSKIRTEADQQVGFRFAPPSGESMPTRVGAKDNLLLMVSNGSLPLLLCLSILTGWLADTPADIAAMVGGVPLLVWFLRPLFTARGRWEPLATGIAFPVLTLVSSALMLLPVVGFYRIHGDPIHPEVLAVRLQDNLESGLTWQALGSFILSLLLLRYLQRRIDRNSPWIEAARAGKFALAWRAAVLTVVFLILVAVGYQTRLSPAEKTWLEKNNRVYTSRPYHALSRNGHDQYWQKRIRAQVKGAPYEPLRLADHPPTSQWELDAASSYMFRGFHAGEDPMVQSETFADYMLLTLKLRPNGNRAYLEPKLDDLLALLSEASLSIAQLQQLKLEFETVKAELFTREEELDLEAYRTLWTEDRDPERAIGWYSPEEVFSWQPGRKSGWTYNGITKARGLVAFGGEYDWSPTRWLKRYQQVKLTRRWLKVREEVEVLSPSEQRQRFESLRDSLGHLDSREREFWDSQSRENQVVGEAERLQRVLEILESRIQRQTREAD